MRLMPADRLGRIVVLSGVFALVIPLGLGLVLRVIEPSAVLLSIFVLLSPGYLFTLFSLSPLDPPDPPVLSFITKSIVAPAILNLCFYGALFSGLIPFERERAAPIAGALLLLAVWVVVCLGVVAAIHS